MKSDYGKPIPLRLSDDTLEKIQLVAKHTGKTQQEVIRLAMDVGLEDLKRCNYDIAGAIVDRAKTVSQADIALLAEKGGGYRPAKTAATESDDGSMTSAARELAKRVLAAPEADLQELPPLQPRASRK